MREVLRSTNLAEIAFAEALLSGEGIAAFVLDVHMSLMEGSLGMLPRRLMVTERDLWRARMTLKDNGLEIST